MSEKNNLNRRVITKICWLSAAEGGREHPPLGPRYSTVARFEKEAAEWPQEAWSIVAEFTDETDESSCVVAEIRLLAHEAPSHLLDPGSKFELYEGHRVVARGEVLREVVEPSSRIIRAHANAELHAT